MLSKVNIDRHCTILSAEQCAIVVPPALTLLLLTVPIDNVAYRTYR